MEIGASGQLTVFVQQHVVADMKKELEFVTTLLQNMVGRSAKEKTLKVVIVTKIYAEVVNSTQSVWFGDISGLICVKMDTIGILFDTQTVNIAS